MKKIVFILTLSMSLQPVLADEVNVVDEFKQHTMFYAVDTEIPVLDLQGLNGNESKLAIGDWIDEIILLNINLDKVIWDLDFIEKFINDYYPDKIDVLEEQAANRSIVLKGTSDFAKNSSFSASKSACVYSGSSCVFEGKGTLNWSQGANYINSIHSAYTQRVSGYSSMYSNNGVIYNNNSASANGTYFFVYRGAFGNETYQASLTLRIRPTFDGYYEFSVLLADHLWINSSWPAPPINK